MEKDRKNVADMVIMVIWCLGLVIYSIAAMVQTRYTYYRGEFSQVLADIFVACTVALTFFIIVKVVEIFRYITYIQYLVKSVVLHTWCNVVMLTMQLSYWALEEEIELNFLTFLLIASAVYNYAVFKDFISKASSRMKSIIENQTHIIEEMEQWQ